MRTYKEERGVRVPVGVCRYVEECVGERGRARLCVCVDARGCRLKRIDGSEKRNQRLKEEERSFDGVSERPGKSLARDRCEVVRRNSRSEQLDIERWKINNKVAQKRR